MSYDEYDDIFISAQKKDAKFVAFVFDIKNSRLMNKQERFNAQIKSFETVNLFVEYLTYLEKENKCKILLDKSPIERVEDITKTKNKTYAFLNNPCVLFGDSFVVYCYNNSIDITLFKRIFKNCLKVCENNIGYHFSYAKFETLDYLKAKEKCYLGYAIEKLCKEKKNEDLTFMLSFQ